MGAISDIIKNYQHVISELDLIMGDKGVFDVEVDGQVIYSKHETDRHVEPGEVLKLFKEFVGPEVRVYGE